MAIATHLTLATGHNILLGDGDEMQTNGEMQRISVSVTYELEQGDTDVPLLATVKASEVAEAHRAAAEVLHAHAFAPLPQPVNPGRSRAELAGSEELRLEEMRLEEVRAEVEDPLRPEEPNEDDPDEDDPDEDDADEDDPDEDSDDQIATPFQEQAFQEQSYQEPAVQRPSLGQAISGAIGSSTAATGSQAFGSRAYPNGVGEVPSGPRITQPQKIAIQSLARQIGLAPYELTSVLQQQFGTWSLERLSKAQAHDLHVALQQSLKEKKEKEKQEKEKQEKAASANNTISSHNTISDATSLSRNGHTTVATS